MADLCGSRGKANVLANRWFQPLTHVSSGAFPRDAADSCQRSTREKRGRQRLDVAQSTAQSVPQPFAVFDAPRCQFNRWAA